MSKSEKLNAHARRQVEKVGRASGMAFAADRMDILKAAKGWLDDNEIDIDSVVDVLVVAEFLAGDRTPERE